MARSEAERSGVSLRGQATMETNNDGELRTVCCMKESERDMAQDILKFNVEPTVNSGENDALRFVSVATDIVSAYVSSNAVARMDLAALIESVHVALRSVGGPKAAEPADPTPRVSVKKSITPDFLISLEDGRPYKALKRHLAGLGLTPEDYRRKWQLPLDYPMVAPNYAIKRSELARKHGLGRKGVVVPDQSARATASGKRKASVETLNDA